MSNDDDVNVQGDASASNVVARSRLMTGGPSLAHVFAVNVDPSGGAGVVAPLGSFVLRTTTPFGMWQKTGAAATAWTPVTGGGGGPLTVLDLVPAIDPFGPGTNMPAGYVDNYSDPSLPTRSLLVVKGADNQGTWLTGLDATGIPQGRVVWLQNLSESGIDVGTIVFKDETSTEALGSLAANRFVTPGAQDYVLPIFGCVALLRDVNKAGAPRWLIQSDNGYAKKSIVQSLQLYPNLQVGTPGAPLVGVNNDWDPVGISPFAPGEGIAGSDCEFQDHTLVRVFVDAAGATISGMKTTGVSNARDWGPIKVIYNQGPGTLTMQHLGAGSVVTNRMYCPNAIDLKIPPLGSAWFLSPYLFNPIATGGQWICLNFGNEIFPTVTTPERTATRLLALEPQEAPAALPSVPARTSNWNAGTGANVAVLTDANGSIVDGMLGTGFFGDVRVLKNVGGGPLIILDQSSSASLGANQFVLPDGEPLVVPSQGQAMVIRDIVSAKWKLMDRGNVMATRIYGNFILPAVLPVGDVNDYDPSDAITGMPGRYAVWWKLQGSVGTRLTGISPTPAGQAFYRNGDRLLLSNYGSGFVLSPLDPGSASGKFFCPGGVDFVIPSLGSVEIQYDQSNTVWLVLAS